MNSHICMLGEIKGIISGQIVYNGLFQKRTIPPSRRKLAKPPSPSSDILCKFKAFFRQSLPPLFGRRKFPLWVGYGSFLERPNHIACNNEQICHFQTTKTKNRWTVFQSVENTSKPAPYALHLPRC